MRQVFVINPKGGCGKTTISTQLSGYFANNDKRVLLADHDAQKSSSDWIGSRPDSCVPIKCVATQPEKRIDTRDIDIVIHDMPAAWTLVHIGEVIQEGDFMLIPVLPSPTDIKACLRYVMGLNREGVVDRNITVGLVANKVRANTRYRLVLNEFLARLQLPLVGELRDTQNYIRLMDRGLSLFDLPENRIKRDIDDWQRIVDWLQ